MSIAIVGGGPTGNLLAILLARRGLAPIVLERGPAPVTWEAPAGRTINLALAARGIAALRTACVFDRIEAGLMPMTGRMLHGLGGEILKLPYGQQQAECLYSTSRAKLNTTLYQVARERYNIEYRFEHECVDLDTETGCLSLRTPGGETRLCPAVIFGTDGAGSALRHSLAASGNVASEELILDHGYKELGIPAGADGQWPLAADGLHIWPRGGFMLIALPNSDGSLTGTLFLAQKGLPGFDQLDAARVGRFFDSQFPDALPLMPELVQQFSTHPVGLLGTVHCRPWHVIRRSAAGTTWQLLLLGDAAHAIVPFHGQGLNAAFEDCIVLDRMIEAMDGDWSRILPAFDAARRPDTEAIAEMSQENYCEMRDGVRAPDFERRGALAFELERRHPDRFIPRYSMVMFHPEIGYADAQSRGRIQAGIIDDLLRLKGNERMILADRLILERLPPVR